MTAFLHFIENGFFGIGGGFLFRSHISWHFITLTHANVALAITDNIVTSNFKFTIFDSSLRSGSTVEWLTCHLEYDVFIFDKVFPVFSYWFDIGVKLGFTNALNI